MDFRSSAGHLEAQSRLRSRLCLEETGAGFSLIELMIVVAIVAIFAAIAAPNFASTLHRSSVTSASNELYDLLQYARGEAVTRGNKVTITAPGVNNSAWNGDVQVTAAGVAAPLRDIGAGGIRSGVMIAANVGVIIFTPTGNASAPACFKLTYATDSNTPMQYIAVQGSGRITPPSTVAPTTGECN